MQNHHDNSKACPAAFIQDSTLVAVIEMSLSRWLVAGMIPGVSRDPLKKLDPNPPAQIQPTMHSPGGPLDREPGGRKMTQIYVAEDFCDIRGLTG